MPSPIEQLNTALSKINQIVANNQTIAGILSESITLLVNLTNSQSGEIRLNDGYMVQCNPEKAAENILAVDLVWGEKNLGTLKLACDRVYPEHEKNLLANSAIVLAMAIGQIQEQSELAKERNRLRTIVDMTPNAYVYVSTTREPADYNPAAVEFFGIDPKTGTINTREVNRYDFFYPDGRRIPKEETPLYYVLKHKTTSPIQEAILRYADGTERNITVVAAPIFGKDNELEGVIGIFQDVGWIKEAERDRLAFMRTNSNGRIMLNQILESIPEGFTVRDNDGSFIEVNEAAKHLLGKAFNENYRETNRILSPQTIMLHANNGKPYDTEELLYVRALKGETIRSEEVIIKIDSQADIYLLFSVQPLTDIDGNVIGLITVFQDVTKIKEAEKAKADFLSTMAHELRTPLSVIKGLASSLLSPAMEMAGDTRLQFLQKLNNETDRMNELISNLLAMARLEAGFMRPDFEEVFIQDLAINAVEQLKPLAEQRRQTIETALEPVLPPLSADYNQILRVLVNLISNAINYAPEESTLEVTAEVTTAESMQEQFPHLNVFPVKAILVCVFDKGEGIPHDEQEKIFDKFYRSKVATKNRKTGTGLGLAICREILALHKGHIWYEPLAEGGNRFCFYLPL
jgi:PAS domain S-box-containing protein